MKINKTNMLKSVLPRAIIITVLGFWTFVLINLFLFGEIRLYEQSKLISGVETITTLFVLIWYSAKMWKELKYKLDNGEFNRA